VQFDGAFEETSRRSAISMSTKQEVDRDAIAVDGSVAVFRLLTRRLKVIRRR